MKAYIYRDIRFDREGFGKVVREKRLELGLTQKELGELLGFSHSFISGVETGSGDVLTVRSLEMVVNVLDIRIYDMAIWTTE